MKIHHKMTLLGNNAVGLLKTKQSMWLSQIRSFRPRKCLRMAETPHEKVVTPEENPMTPENSEETLYRNDSVKITIDDDLATQTCFRHVMRNVPQPVVVVTTAVLNKKTGVWVKRGVTCSSFTSVALRPPVISVAINMPSRIHDLMEETRKFAVHVLAKNQVKYAVHFASPAVDGTDQFEGIPHELNNNVPVLRDTSAVLQCESHSVNLVGDHSVWYGKVVHAYTNEDVMQPLLYYAKSFREVGDELFIQAFEDTTLPFKDWTHEAHIRMAWNYIKEKGKDSSTPTIIQGIKKYNEQNKDAISRGYHETVTQFYIHMIANAVSHLDDGTTSFTGFVEENDYILDKNLLFEYYTDELINSDEAKYKFLPPDKKDLP